MESINYFELLSNHLLNLIIIKLELYDIITLTLTSKYFKKIIELNEFDIDYNFELYEHVSLNKFKNIKKIVMPELFKIEDIYDLGDNIKDIKISSKKYNNLTDNGLNYFKKLENIHLEECYQITNEGIINLLNNNINLKKIKLINNNKLNNKIFNFMINKKIMKLNLSNFKEMDEIENLSNLLSLSLSNCQINNDQLNKIFENNKKLNKLKLINIENIDDNGLQNINKNMEKIHIENNDNITNIGLEYIFSKTNKLKNIKLKNLKKINDNSIKSLTIYNNNLKKIIFDNINITNLSLLKIAYSNNNIKYVELRNLINISDHGTYELFRKNENIETLIIKNIIIRDESFKILKNLKIFCDYGECNKMTIIGYKFLFVLNENLKKVFIINSNIVNDQVIDTLFSINTKLEYLLLCNINKLTNKMFDNIDNEFTNLKYLKLSDINITNEGLIKLIKQNRIREIDINKELLTENLIKKLKEINHRVYIHK